MIEYWSCSFFFLYIDGGRGTSTVKDGEIVRKKIGLEWMLRPKRQERTPTINVEDQPKQTSIEEICIHFVRRVFNICSSGQLEL